MRVTFWNSFEECEEPARRLLESGYANPFLGFDWLKLHWQHFGSKAGRELLLAGVWEGEELICFAPLRFSRRLGGLREIGLVGEGLSDYLGFVGEASPRTLEALISSVTQRWPDALFRFHDIDHNTNLREALDHTTMFARRARVRLYPCSHRDMDAVEETRLSSAKKKHRQHIRSSIRRLEKMGDFRFFALDFDQDRDTGLKLLPKLFELHRLRHDGTLNAWCRKRNLDFLEEYLRTAQRASAIAFVVELDGTPVAFEIVVRHGPRMVLYIPAFHPAFAAFRLGHVNLHLMMEYCAEAGIRIVDFSKGASQAKRHWATGESCNYCYYAVRNSSLRNRLLMSGELLALRAKVWGREKGVNAFIRVQLGKAKREAASRWRRQAARPAGALSPDGEWKQFRYRDVADLPVDPLTKILDFVYRNISTAPVSFRHLPGEIILRGADSPNEVRVPVPREHESAQAYSALTGGAE